MYSRERVEIALVAGLLISAFLVVATIRHPETELGTCEFVISSWDYPDTDGQGIWGAYVYENSTGSWVYVGVSEHDDDSAYVWNASIAIKLRVFTMFNSTLTGAASTAEGQLLQRHNVTVTNRQGDVIFSQANFTYVEVLTVLDPIWTYSYDVVLNFLPAATQYYTAKITYEVFYA